MNCPIATALKSKRRFPRAGFEIVGGLPGGESVHIKMGMGSISSGPAFIIAGQNKKRADVPSVFAGEMGPGAVLNGDNCLQLGDDLFINLKIENVGNIRKNVAVAVQHEEIINPGAQLCPGGKVGVERVGQQTEDVSVVAFEPADGRLVYLSQIGGSGGGIRFGADEREGLVPVDRRQLKTDPPSG